MIHLVHSKIITNVLMGTNRLFLSLGICFLPLQFVPEDLSTLSYSSSSVNILVSISMVANSNNAPNMYCYV